ncbi:CDP-glycerol glycerophosphotransferase [Quadrisphaera granulorum]|uniref:CDP-glycerol glycerophosphotransferase n=1 Tax=Quadrisphaera granulorum TaxID=317664 RepID=A0A316A831_9ACTN|nr:CDP-glycerol glycerophosphotransferase family protein [Quadrisphaera granulorum]PWJ53783.1 CDP-glycerol glycerophosphotransferase [Quadrisphaera granulorum]SZE96540.1 CDP-glycerol glycerophosphotransferase [Quadrisphaera granulorum]
MKIVYNSFDGRYSDSPRALYEALTRTGRGVPLEHTWLAAPAHRETFPDGPTLVAPDGAEAVAALEAADVVISNYHLRPQWAKAPGCLYLQTWHGTPLKRIAADEPHVTADDPVPGWRDVDRWDLLLSSGPVATRALTSGFRWTGPIAETGWPRNDVLLSPQRDELRTAVRAQLGVAEDTTAVLYAPTWRDDVLDADGRRDVDLRIDLAEFSRRFAQQNPTHVLLLRLHYMLSDRLADTALPPGVIDVSRHPDIAELYLAADTMVTDYSSTLFDFAATRKPLLLFAYDLEHYRDDVRGFYFDLFGAPPGPVLRTSDDLLDALADPVASTEAWVAQADAFRAEHCPLDDGGASERALDLVLPGRVAEAGWSSSSSSSASPSGLPGPRGTEAVTR